MTRTIFPHRWFLAVLVMAAPSLLHGTDSVNADPAILTTAAPAEGPNIKGAEVTKTKGEPSGLSFKNCADLTAADYQQIRTLDGLKALSFAHGPDDASLKLLEDMPAIESFGTNGALLTDAGLPTLASLKNLRNLTFFHPGRGLTGTGFAALATLPNLENLTVAGSLEFADAGMAAVGQLTHLKAFRTWHTGVTIEGVKSLGSLKELHTLMIGQRLSNKPPATMNDDTITVLATFSSLESLSVAEARLSLSALSKLGQIPHLKILSLMEIEISESDIATLKQRLPKTRIEWTAPSPSSQKRIDGIFGPAGNATAPGAPPRGPAKT